MANMKNIVVMKLVDFDDELFHLMYFENTEVGKEELLEKDKNEITKTELLEKDKNEMNSHKLNVVKHKLKSDEIIENNNKQLHSHGFKEKRIMKGQLTSNVSNQDKSNKKNKKSTLMKNMNSKLLLKNMLKKHFSTQISRNSVTIDNVKFSDYKTVLLFLTANKIIKINESDLLKLMTLFKKIKVPIKYMGKLAKKILL